MCLTTINALQYWVCWDEDFPHAVRIFRLNKASTRFVLKDSSVIFYIQNSAGIPTSNSDAINRHFLNHWK